MMRHRLSSARVLGAVSLLGLIALAACGGGGEEASDDAAAPNGETQAEAADATAPGLVLPPEDASIAAGDVLGAFEGTVGGVALWQNARISFQSAVVAANGDAGLFAIGVDRDGATSTPGTFDAGVDVTYTDERLPVVAAFDGQLGAIQFFTIATGDREFLPLGSTTIDHRAETLCFAGTTLFSIDGEGTAYFHELDTSGGTLGVTTEPVASLDAVHCDGDDQRAYFLTQNGRVISISAEGRDIEDASLRAASLSAPRGTQQIAALPMADGTTRLVFLLGGSRISLGDGDGLPVSEIDDSSATPSDIKLMVAAGGNFGSVYREGLLAMVTETGSLSIVPWLSVARAFGVDNDTRSLQGDDAGVSSDIVSTTVVPDGGPGALEIDEDRLDALRQPPPTLPAPTEPEDDGE